METHHLGRHCWLVTEDRTETRPVTGTRCQEPQGGPPNPRDQFSREKADLAKVGIAWVENPRILLSFLGNPSGDSVRILFYEGGSPEWRVNAKGHPSAPERVFLQTALENPRRTVEPTRLLMLTLDGAFVRSEVERRFGRVPPPETWAGGFSVGSPAVATLRSFCIWMAEEVDREDSPLATVPRVQITLEKTLITMFIECLAERLPGGPAGGDDLADAHVRAIESWIEANLGEPISVDDLAAVVDVSPRSVQKTFRRLRGCSPMTWVSRCRLARAHDLLVRADPGTTVTGVALDCGFFQLGRFAVRYREAFDEKPSETLARARRTAMQCVQNERARRPLSG